MRVEGYTFNLACATLAEHHVITSLEFSRAEQDKNRVEETVFNTLGGVVTWQFKKAQGNNDHLILLMDLSGVYKEHQEIRGGCTLALHFKGNKLTNRELYQCKETEGGKRVWLRRSIEYPSGKETAGKQDKEPFTDYPVVNCSFLKSENRPYKIGFEASVDLAGAITSLSISRASEVFVASQSLLASIKGVKLIPNAAYLTGYFMAPPSTGMEQYSGLCLNFEYGPQKTYNPADGTPRPSQNLVVFGGFHDNKIVKRMRYELIDDSDKWNVFSLKDGEKEIKEEDFVGLPP